MHYRHYLRVITLFFCTISIILFVNINLYLAPSIAQVQEKAPIVLDGQAIFEVSEFAQYTAKERADLTNFQLKSSIQSDTPLNVTVGNRNQLPTILLNGNYLMTVTTGDVISGNTTEEQAKLWAKEIQKLGFKAQNERSQEYFRNATVIALILATVAIAIFWGLGWLRKRFRQSIKQKLSSINKDGFSSILDLALSLILTTSRIIVIVTTILYIADLFPSSRSLGYQVKNVILSSFTSPLINLGKSSYSVIDLLILSVMILGLVLFARVITNLLRQRILNLAGINRGTQDAIAVIAQYSLIFVGTLILLQIWGLDLSSLTILASALGIGLGIGLQDIAKNFGSGLILVFERPIQVGDFIEVGNLHGTVERIGARSTEIRTLDLVSIIVPNSRFLDSEVINWSHGNPISRLHIPLGVGYGSNPTQVRLALMEAANHPKVLQSPPPQVLFKGFGDNSLDFELLVWTSEPHKQFLLKSDLRFLIFEILAQNQIEIPFPQRDLNLKSGKIELSSKLESALIKIAERINPDVSKDDLQNTDSDCEDNNHND